MSRACAGIPFAYVRALEPDERAWLAERARRLRRRRIAYGCGTALVPLLLCAPLMLALAENAAGLLIVPALGACVVLPLRWIDARKRSAFASNSAGATSADVFEGEADAGMLAEEGLPDLMATGLVLDEETPQRLDRIGASGEVIGLNGGRLDPPRWANETDVAAPAWTSHEFPTFLPDFAMDAPQIERRALSSAEGAELRRLTRGAPLRKQGCFFLCIAYMAAGVVIPPFTQPNDPTTKPFVVVRLVILGFLVSRLIPAIRERRLLRRDLAEATVARIADDAHGAMLEILPHSSLVWTVHGHPSPWRHAVQSAARPPR